MFDAFFTTRRLDGLCERRNIKNSMKGDLTGRIVMLCYHSHVYSMQETWATKTGRVSIRYGVAWMDGWRSYQWTLRPFSQGYRCRFYFLSEACVSFDTILLSLLGNLGCLMWASEIKVSSTDGVYTCGVARFLLGFLRCACLCDASVGSIKMSFPERQLTTTATTMTQDSYGKLTPLWHQIGMKS